MFESPKIHLLTAFASAALLFPSPSTGTGISLDSITSAASWEEEDGTDNSSVSEYVSFTSRGELGGFRLDVEGYGRFTYLEEELEPGDEDVNRLYTLAMTLRGRDGGGMITVGRHFIPALTGPEMVDGLSIEAVAGKAAFNARWGRRSDVSGGPEEDNVLGMGFEYTIKKGMYFTLDYGRTYDDRLLTELLAAEWVYSWYRFTKAYINFNWDLMSRTLHESLVGTRLYFSDRFSAVLELAHHVEVFDSDSIYSVFAVDAAYTRSFSLLFTPSRTTRYVWDYAVESYKGSGSGSRYAISGHWTPGRTRIFTSLQQHSGYGGDLLEISASVSTPLLDDLRVGIGGDISTTENPGENSVRNSLLYLGGELALGRDASVGLRLEQSDDDLTRTVRSGRLSMKVEF